MDLGGRAKQEPEPRTEPLTRVSHGLQSAVLSHPCRFSALVHPCTSKRKPRRHARTVPASSSVAPFLPPPQTRLRAALHVVAHCIGNKAALSSQPPPAQKDAPPRPKNPTRQHGLALCWLRGWCFVARSVLASSLKAGRSGWLLAWVYYPQTPKGASKQRRGGGKAALKGKPLPPKSPRWGDLSPCQRRGPCLLFAVQCSPVLNLSRPSPAGAPLRYAALTGLRARLLRNGKQQPLRRKNEDETHTLGNHKNH